ncbi:MAG: NAD(P)H-binding protein [Pseudohongiellaceae bacterium]
MKIAVTGANSSVGRNLLSHIAARDDVTAVAGVRSEQAAGSLPTSDNIAPKVISYSEPVALDEAFAGVDSVVHLAGILFESRGSSYQSANVQSTASVVRAAERAGVSHLLFISVIGADAASANAYLRSKGEAEQLVSDSAMATTIIRTPMLMGPDTAAGQSVAASVRDGRAKLLGGGRYTLRPLDIDDLSRAVLQACQHPPENSQLYELVGPEPVRYRDLLERAAQLKGKKLQVTSAPIWLARLFAGIRYRIRREGLSPAIIDVITADEVTTDKAVGDPAMRLTPLSETLEKTIRKV